MNNKKYQGEFRARLVYISIEIQHFADSFSRISEKLDGENMKT